MSRQIGFMLLLVGIAVVFAAPAKADFVTGGLIFYADAELDDTGSDGWTFSQPAASSPPTGPLSVIGSAPSKVEQDGVQMFVTTNTSQAFGAGSPPISMAGVSDFTFQIGLIRYTDFNSTSEAQIAAWRRDPDFGGNFFGLYLPSGSQVTLDYRDRQDTPVRATHSNVADIGADTFHLLTVTYKDATGAGNNDGVLSVYLDNTLTFQSTTEQLYMAGGNGADFGAAYAFVIAPGEVYRNFNGGIMFMNLYNRVLSESELAQNYAEFSGRLVPEPSSLALLAAGIVGLLAYAWRKRR